LDIDGWLRVIGLEQYRRTFRDNAIDADLARLKRGDEHGAAQALDLKEAKTLLNELHA
jgi:SAM domain (Sterile alpha motif)